MWRLSALAEATQKISVTFFSGTTQASFVIFGTEHQYGENIYIYIYYTSEEFFLYKMTVDKQTIHHFSRQNELLTGT